MERLRARAARDLIRQILDTGEVLYVPHYHDEAKKDAVLLADIEELLAHGLVEEPEFENGEWRYRVRRFRLSAIVAFRSETMLAVITVWKNER